MALHITSLDQVRLENTWLTIGSFDGVHIGHQELIKELNTSAHNRGAKSVVLTFHPHPAAVIRGRKDAFYLTIPSEKAELLDDLGVDVVVIFPFTFEVSQSSAREFVKYLLQHIQFHQLWVGQDFALGKGREGNVDYLKQLGGEFAFQVHTVIPVTVDGQTVSSSQIRKLLADGKIEGARRLLGRPYRVSGNVVHGDGRGKSIGIPTANLDTGSEKLIPGAGVYACEALVDGVSRPAAVNIGTRPTFKSDDRLSHIEAHILDYSRDLYSSEIKVDFISRLRGEVRFDSVEELIGQVRIDIEKTREIISEFRGN